MLNSSTPHPRGTRCWAFTLDKDEMKMDGDEDGDVEDGEGAAGDVVGVAQLPDSAEDGSWLVNERCEGGDYDDDVGVDGSYRSGKDVALPNSPSPPGPMVYSYSF
jgi:hypothetical protein